MFVDQRVSARIEPLIEQFVDTRFKLLAVHLQGLHVVAAAE
jgi:hypothetical protein